MLLVLHDFVVADQVLGGVPDPFTGAAALLNTVGVVEAEACALDLLLDKVIHVAPLFFCTVSWPLFLFFLLDDLQACDFDAKVLSAHVPLDLLYKDCVGASHDSREKLLPERGQRRPLL